MRLTKKQAIEEHRKMWNWIAEQYHNRDVADVRTLKQEYVEANFPDRAIINDCFCCEYASQFTNEYEEICKYCPLEWPSTEEKFPCEITGVIKDGLDGLVSKLYKSYLMEHPKENTPENKSRIAKQIAELPERSGQWET